MSRQPKSSRLTVILLICFFVGALFCLVQEPLVRTVKPLVGKGEVLKKRLGPETLNREWQWHAATTVNKQGLTEQQQKTVAELEAIGYASGYEQAPGLNNVTVHKPEKAFQGFNVYTSGHAPEAFLIDMNGKVLHSWKRPARDAEDCWRRVFLLPGGDLLAIHEGHELIRIDKESTLVWSVDRGFHHDLDVDHDKRIFALSRRASLNKAINTTEPVLEDFITILNPEGSVIREISLLKAFETSKYRSFLAHMPDHGDLFHTNTLTLFDGSRASLSPLFKKGNALISLRTIDVIAIIDIEKETIVWALAGQWLDQHEPVLTDRGTMLLFDNLGHNGLSKVIEFDPFTQEILWAYEGTQENGFFSKECGSVSRLPNGNTLVTESWAGRAFELTPQNEIVWEFYNPARAGDNNELIGTLFEMQRIQPEQVTLIDKKL